MGMVVSIIGAFLTQARDAATKSTLNKVQGLANQRAQALNRLSMRKGAITTTDPMQKILAIKSVTARYFPQRVVELSYADQPALYTKLVNVFSQAPPVGQSLPNPNNLPQGDLTQYKPTLDPFHTLRSSEILYDFLTQANVLGDTPITTDAFTSSEVQDTDNNGAPEFVDAWGQPLRFYRWPTRFFRSNGVIAGNPPQLSAITTPLNPTVKNSDGSYDTNNARLLFASLPVFSGNLAQDLNRDPDDPLRLCTSNSLLPSGLTFMQAFEQNFHTPATYHTLLIVSSGPDLKLGLCEPDGTAVNPTNGSLAVVPFGYLALTTSVAFSATTEQDALTDNIMYLNVRAGGK